MLKKALGFIETYGYVGAIEAADSCLKAADVKLINCQFAGKGLVTIIVEGDVSSVKASIDAGATAAESIGQVVGINVIARPGDGLEKICLTQKSAEVPQEVVSEQVDAIRADSKSATSFVYCEGEKIPFDNIETFQTMKVVELRKIARQVKDISIKKDQIKYAKRDELLEAIKKAIEEVD
ncbi:BMC domain-containing protein [Vallitalea okinawensis]|uniref:BMC domain-containing protein n=1 Tax=Vallitalea okinawensis TaxID=2078660 RepID=UPI000CFDE301|nr:BMC domain-containing protein [Vallitalea okinawensis]